MVWLYIGSHMSNTSQGLVFILKKSQFNINLNKTSPLQLFLNSFQALLSLDSPFQSWFLMPTISKSLFWGAHYQGDF